MSAAASPAQRQFNARSRLAGLALAILVLFVGLGAVTALLWRGWGTSLDERRDARQAGIDLADLSLALSDEDAAAREFVVSGGPDLLQQYADGLAREGVALSALASRDPSVAEHAANVSRLRASIDRWHGEAVEPAIEIRRSGAAPDPALDDLSTRLFAEVRVELDGLELTLDKAVKAADQSTSNRQRLVVGAVVGTSLFLLAGFVLMATLFRRWVTNPLSEIGVVARAIGSGEPAAMPSYRARELAAVSEAVDYLQRSLSTERDRAVRTYKSLEQSAVLALHVRSELAAGDDTLAADGWTLAATSRPAEGIVAGDCHALGLVNPRLLYVVLIDVTGHGPVAALNALKAKALLRSALRSGMAPGEAVSWLSRQGTEHGELEILTSFVGVLELASGVFRYANAGHPPGLVVDGSGEGLMELNSTGPLVGAFEATWHTDTTVIPPGATLVLYTDGLTDQAGDHRERLGEERVKECLSHAADGGAHIAIASLMSLMEKFRTGPQADDITIVAATRDSVDSDSIASDTAHDPPSGPLSGNLRS